MTKFNKLKKLIKSITSSDRKKNRKIKIIFAVTFIALLLKKKYEQVDTPLPESNFNELFFEDYCGTKWNKSNITWSIVDDRLYLPKHPKGNYVDVINISNNLEKVKLIEKAFNLWDDALSSITFSYTDNGNDADITVGIVKSNQISSDGRWNYIYNQNNNITNSCIRVIDRNSEDWFLTTMLHEIGNVLGLGDIKPRKDIQSIQEDPFPKKFPVSAESLWNFDVRMIKYLYGEPVEIPIFAA